MNIVGIGQSHVILGRDSLNFFTLHQQKNQKNTLKKQMSFHSNKQLTHTRHTNPNH